MNAELGWLPWAVFGALLFFAAGWVFARVDIKSLLSESRALPRAYFRGLNFLLNEQPDKALDAFIEVTHANPEATELQFAIGNLFRRRGEVDRAIRVHLDLSERRDLGAALRAEALFELALDYQKAGLLDHAAQILVDLDAHSSARDLERVRALTLLLNIRVQERDWQQAITVASALDEMEGGKHRPALANFHCEIATAASARGAFDEAQTHVDAAQRVNPKCVRAPLLRGDWHAAAGRHAEAIAVWREIEHLDPAYLGLMAEKVLASYAAIGRDQEGLDYLRDLHRQYPALDLLNVIFRATLKAEGAEAAYQLMKADLRDNPTLVGLDHLIEAQLLAAPAERQADLQVLKTLVHAHSSRLAVYMCQKCGFKAKQFYWQCPACAGWETFPPRRTAEYETADRHLAQTLSET